LVAVQERPNYTSYTSLSEEYGLRERRSKTRPLPRRQQLILAGLALLVFCAGVFIVFFYAQMVITGYQIHKLQREAASLDMQVRDLSTELARLSSLERVEMVATTRLGMVRPDLKTMVVVRTEPEKETASGGVPEQTAKAKGSYSVSEAGKERNWVIQALVNLVDGKRKDA